MVDRHGPTHIARAEVEIDGELVEGWSEIELPSQTTEEGEYREGDDADYEKKIWGQTTFGTLTMERAIQSDDTKIWDWSQAVVQGNVGEARKEVEITFQDGEGEPLVRWGFTEAWIQHYDPPGLDSTADDDMATERIVVAFDKMIREEPTG